MKYTGLKELCENIELPLINQAQYENVMKGVEPEEIQELIIKNEPEEEHNSNKRKSDEEPDVRQKSGRVKEEMDIEEIVIKQELID